MRSTYNFFLRTFLLLVFISSVACDTEAQLISDELKQNVRDRVEKVEFPGIAIAVFNSRQTEFFNQGKMQFGGDTDVDENTLFEIGSISKTFTAIMLAEMMQRGEMSLDDPISRYVPDTLKTPSRNGKEIMLRHLVSHTSGLPRMPSNFSPANPFNPYVDYSVEQLFEFLHEYKLNRDPGYSYLYSNYGMGLLGNLLERHNDKTYEALLVDLIASPLGMKDTRIGLNEELQSRFARGHRGSFPVSQWDIITLAGAGGIRSTTTDMVKYIKANMGLIDTALKDAMEQSHQPVITAGRNDEQHAMAWVYMNGNQDVLWHNGGTGGFRTFAGFNKKTGIGVVVLTNSNTGADDIGFHLLDSSRPLKKP